MTRKCKIIIVIVNYAPTSHPHITHPVFIRRKISPFFPDIYRSNENWVEKLKKWVPMAAGNLTIFVIKSTLKDLPLRIACI